MFEPSIPKEGLSPLGRRESSPRGPAEAGPGSIPEENHAALRQHVGDPYQVPFLAFTSIESILYLLPDAPILVQHQFLGKESFMLLLCHESSFINQPPEDLAALLSVCSSVASPRART